MILFFLNSKKKCVTTLRPTTDALCNVRLCHMMDTHACIIVIKKITGIVHFQVVFLLHMKVVLLVNYIASGKNTGIALGTVAILIHMKGVSCVSIIALKKVTGIVYTIGVFLSRMKEVIIAESIVNMPLTMDIVKLVILHLTQEVKDV